MRALRTLFTSLPLAALLGTFALPPVVLTGGAACAAENTPDPPGQSTTAQPATGNKLPAHSPLGAAPDDIGSSSAADPSAPLPHTNTASALRPGPPPLPTPVTRSAQCPAAPLPPNVQRLCAEAAALLEALHAAASTLPNRRDIRMGITDFNEYTALAAELYTPLTEVNHAVAGGDSGAQAITVTLLARPDASETLLRLLRNPDALQVRRLLLADLTAALEKTRQVTQKIATTYGLSDSRPENIPPGSGGTWYIAKATQPGQLAQHPPQALPGEAAQEAARQAVQQKADALEKPLAAAIAVQDTLRLSPEGWLTSTDALSTLEDAAASLPQSAATQLVLGEALLQAGMPQRSIGACTAALELAPDFARARYIRALAHWRLQQLALAEDDLSAALEGTAETFPHTSDKVRLFRARGALRMLRSNTPGMCEDLVAACALGDCEGLAAAREKQLCLVPATGTTPSSLPATSATPAPEDTAAKP